MDPTGVLNSTAALNQAIQDAMDYNLALYLPSGTYLVSDTLLGRQQWAQSGCATTVGNGTGWSARQIPSLIGPSQGTRPVIVLADHALGFDDPDLPRGVVQFIADGNPGAVGLVMPSAQYSTIEDVKVDATGGYAGVRGVPTTNVVVNLEVDGDRYGVIPATCCGGSFAGLVLRDQIEAALLVNTFGTVVVSGFRIEKAAAPAVVLDQFGQQAQLVMLDGVIVITSGSDPALDNRGTNQGGQGKDLYMRNVYMNVPGPLEQSGTNAPIPSSER